MTVSVKAPTSTTGSIQLNGSDVINIDSSGNIGIGISSPSSYANQKTMTINGTNYGRLDVANGGTVRGSVYGGSVGITIAGNGALPVGFETSGTERMRIDSSGNVLVGTTSPEGKVTIDAGSSNYGQIVVAKNGYFGIGVRNTSGTGSWQAMAFFTNGSQVGGINCSSTATTYATSSDYRLKENIAPMSGSIDRLKQLKPSTWSWTQDGSHGEGFLAHEAQAVVPEAVTGTKDAVDDEGNPEYQGIDQSKLVPLLTAALQEAITKIEDLETRIQALESA